jgi:hypothetical protein
MKRLALLMMALAPLFAQESADVKEARHRFDLVSTRAIAYLHSADSIEKRLNEDGATLHPQILSLRFRIAAALDQAHRAIVERDLKSADESMTAADALVGRLAQKLGGN